MTNEPRDADFAPEPRSEPDAEPPAEPAPDTSWVWFEDVSKSMNPGDLEKK